MLQSSNIIQLPQKRMQNTLPFCDHDKGYLERNQMTSQDNYIFLWKHKYTNGRHDGLVPGIVSVGNCVQYCIHQSSTSFTYSLRHC